MLKRLLKYNVLIIVINLIISTFLFSVRSPYNLTVLGGIRMVGSQDRLPIILIDTLKEELKINFIRTGFFYDLSYIPDSIKKIIKNPDKTPGDIAILYDHPWFVNAIPANSMPNSLIRMAYSTLESTAIPQEWVHIFNTHFDAVIVPDEFIKNVYYNSGVRIPLFVIPEGMYLDDLLEMPLKSKKGYPFVFGCSAAFWPRKNQELLLEAFFQEFGNSPHVRLRLHGKDAHDYYIKALKNKVKQYNLSNVEIIYKGFKPQEYTDFLNSLDCYVLLSKGEGFSLTPREALALGLPCILSNNTAHTSICNTNLVIAVSSTVKEPYFDANLSLKGAIGYIFNCTVLDVCKALREVYEHYEYHLEKNAKRREWARQYLYKSLKSVYLTLFAPKKVELGENDLICGNTLITTSSSLYDKYLNLILLNKP